MFIATKIEDIYYIPMRDFYYKIGYKKFTK